VRKSAPAPQPKGDGEQRVEMTAVADDDPFREARIACLVADPVDIDAGREQAVRPSRMMCTTRNGVSAAISRRAGLPYAVPGWPRQ